MKKFSAIDWIALVVLFIGGLNWGLIGIFNLNLVGWIFGEMSTIARTIYILVGISAVYVLFISSSCKKEIE